MTLRNNICHFPLPSNMRFNGNNVWESFIAPITKNGDLKLGSNYSVKIGYSELINQFISKSEGPIY